MLRNALFSDDANALRWYLSARGYPVSTHRRNRRLLYLLTKFDGHEHNFINQRSGFVSESTWTAMKNGLEADLKIGEFKTMWPNARRFYDTDFVAYVEDVAAAP